MLSKPTSVKTILEINNISVHYGKKKVLNNVSIEMPDGIIVALIGANGAGKSTLLKTISGLIKPATGEIWYAGERIDNLPAHTITKMKIVQVPEGRRLFAKMNVLENLKIGMTNPKKYQANIELVFHFFPILEKRVKQLAGTLSGGEQQMLAIGRALMAEPRLLLLDEPTLGLSPIMVRQIAEIIVKINKEGNAILLSEQNALLALQLSKIAYVLETGVIALQGSTETLIRNEGVRKAYLTG